MIRTISSRIKQNRLKQSFRTQLRESASRPTRYGVVSQGQVIIDNQYYPLTDADQFSDGTRIEVENIGRPSAAIYRLADVGAVSISGGGGGGGGGVTTLPIHTHASNTQGGQISHGVLLGLSNDDHPQYLRADGTREGATAEAQAFGLGVVADTISEYTPNEGVTVDGVLLKDQAATVDSLFFDTTATAQEVVGEMVWNPDRQTLDFYMPGDVTYQMGQELFFYVVNRSGVTIPDGAVVMFDPTGTLGASGKIACQLAVTDGTYPSTMLMGIATQEILDTEDGKVTFFGEVRGINTSAWAKGTILYPDPSVPGGLTSTVPDAPNLRYQIAVVIVQSATVGEILVRAISSVAIADADDVYINNSEVYDGEILQYDGTDGRWENHAVAIKQTVPSSESVTVRSGYQMLVNDKYEVDGTLIVDGTLVVLGSYEVDPDALAEDAVTPKPQYWSYTHVTSNYFISVLDVTIGVTCSTADITLLLPVAEFTTGIVFNIKKLDDSGYNVIITDILAGIDGESSIIITDQWVSITVQSTGEAWIII